MTTDSGMDVSPSWQELKDERDALVATVKHMKALADEAYGSYAACHEHECAAALTKMIGIDPTTSLARLKAEALTDFAKWAQNDLTLDGLFINFDELIKRYRRQAEEAS